jgi:hypothetical protein
LKYSFPEAELVDQEIVGEETLVEGIITYSSIAGSESNDVTGYELLKKVLKTIPKNQERGTKLIIEGDGRGPSNAFVYPVGGLRPPGKEFAIERERRASIKVPDVLPIQLPTGQEMPLDAASPVTSRGKLSQQRSSIDVPSLPILGTASMSDAVPGTSKRSDGKVEKLLSKIPNLNFMLQSTLVLPKK